MKELYSALAKAHGELGNPKKNKTVTVTHKDKKGKHSFKYATLDSIIDYIKPILSSHGLCIFQRVAKVDDTLSMITCIVHDGGGLLESAIPMMQIPTDPKDYGGRLTYMRRYGLCAALNISAEDDTDAPSKWQGPLNKTALRAQISAFNIGVGKCNSSTELMAHHQDFEDVINQAKTDMPSLIIGDNRDGICVQDHYKTTLKNLIEIEKHQKEFEPHNVMKETS